MKRRKQSKKNTAKKLIGRFDIPQDIVFDIPRIMLCDNTEMRIENYKTILEYKDTEIQLACKEKLIHVQGEKLDITIITDDEISIKGMIQSISFA